MNKNLPLPKGLERRYARAEFRADNADGKKRIRGYAATWNNLSEDLGGFREKLSAGCFAESLGAHPDIFLLNGHDTTVPLARVSNNSLTVREDARGLRFTASLEDTTAGVDAFKNIRGGLLSGMSFGMVVGSDLWEEGPDPESRKRISIRTVRTARLLEISCVAFPAYRASSVEARHRALFPGGIPGEIRSRLALRTDEEMDDSKDDCGCDCTACAEGDCSECTNESCSDLNCRACPYSMRALRTIVDDATLERLSQHAKGLAREIEGLPSDHRAAALQALMLAVSKCIGINGADDGNETEADRNLRRHARLLGHALTI